MTNLPVPDHAWVWAPYLAGDKARATSCLREVLHRLSRAKGESMHRGKLRESKLGIPTFMDAVLWGAVKRGYVDERKNHTRASWTYDYVLTDAGKEWLGQNLLPEQDRGGGGRGDGTDDPHVGA